MVYSMLLLFPCHLLVFQHTHLFWILQSRVNDANEFFTHLGGRRLVEAIPDTATRRFCFRYWIEALLLLWNAHFQFASSREGIRTTTSLHGMCMVVGRLIVVVKMNTRIQVVSTKVEFYFLNHDYFPNQKGRANDNEGNQDFFVKPKESKGAAAGRLQTRFLL